MDTQGDLYTIAPPSSILDPLLTTAEPVTSPAPSPDGLSFAYDRYLGGEHRLAVARRDGANVHDLVTSCARYPEWAPDGLTIAFSCDTSGAGLSDIAIVPAAGGPLLRITQTPDTNEEHPSWSPDGSQLVFFVSGAGGGLFRINANGTGRVRVTSDDSDRDPEWSPLGDRIVFVRGLNPNRAIWTVKPDGSEEQPVTGSQSYNHSPTWSPDGQTIAFVRDLGSSFDLFFVNANGTNEHRVTTGISIGNPQWSH